MNDFLTNNIEMIITIVSIFYTALVYFLPKKYSTKIGFIIDIIEYVANVLSKARDSKGGLSPKEDLS